MNDSDAEACLDAGFAFIYAGDLVSAARKHFRALGLDYRVVTDLTPDWYLPSDEIPSQAGLTPSGSEP